MNSYEKSRPHYDPKKEELSKIASLYVSKNGNSVKQEWLDNIQKAAIALHLAVIHSPDGSKNVKMQEKEDSCLGHIKVAVKHAQDVVMSS